MNDAVYRVCGIHLADRVLGKQTVFTGLFRGENDNDIFSLDVEDSDTIVLRGNKKDLDDAVKTLAIKYEQDVVSRYDMSKQPGDPDYALSVDKDGNRTSVDYNGDFYGNIFRVYGKDLATKCQEKLDFRSGQMVDLLAGNNPVSLRVCDKDSVIICGVSKNDLRNTVKRLATHYEQGIVSYVDISDGCLDTYLVSIDKNADFSIIDWTGKKVSDLSGSEPYLQNNRRLPCNGAFEYLDSQGVLPEKIDGYAVRWFGD